MRLRWWTAAALASIVLHTSPSSAQQALNNLERSLSQTPPAKQAAPEPQPPGTASPGTATPDAAPESDEPGYLGIIADDRETQGRGVRLLDVLADGPAAVGGLQLNDLITSIDGVAVTSLDDMAAVMRDRVVGEEVTFVVLRGEQAATLNVVLTKRPPPEQRRFKNFGRIQDEGVDVMVPGDPGATPSVMPVPTERSIPHPEPDGALPPVVAVPVNPNGPVATAARTGLLGIRAVRITPELQLAMNLPEPRGALVVEVRPDSPAKAAGIPIDAVITAADGKPIDEPEDLGEIVRERGPGAEIRLSYFRLGQLFERRVKLAAPPGALAAPTTGTGPVLSTGPAAPAPAPAPAKREPEAMPSGESAEEAKVRARIAEIERELAELKRQLESQGGSTQSGKQSEPR